MNLKSTILITINLVAGLLSVSPVMAQKATDLPKERPNVVFILSDDHSVPYLGCYGNKDMNTPNLDKLASEGIRYNRAYTTAPQCVLSRASIMTGRSTVDIRMTRFTAALPREIISFPEVLRDAGYFVGLCGRNFHLDGPDVGKIVEVDEIMLKYNLRTFKDRVDYLNIGWNGEVIYQQFVEFLDSVPDDTPFFIQVGYSDPHRVFTAPEYEPSPDTINVPESMPDTKLLREDLAAHIGEINRCDHDLGRVLAELERRGLAANTLVVFMGDNGAALLRGKGTLYECGLNVPLLARWPGHIESGLVNNELISGEDIAVTFLEAAGAKKDEKMTGKSFINSFHGDAFKGHDYVFAVRGSHGSGLPTNSSPFDLGRVIIGQRYKLIYNVIWQIPYNPVDFSGQAFWNELKELNEEDKLDEKFSKVFFEPQRSMFEVYDLETDPFEFNNLSGKPEIEELEYELKKELLTWMVLNQDYLPLPIQPSPNKKE
jgi:N-sulfoglucosamine sulfohydrolase